MKKLYDIICCFQFHQVILAIEFSQTLRTTPLDEIEADIFEGVKLPPTAPLELPPAAELLTTHIESFSDLPSSLSLTSASSKYSTHSAT